MQKQNKELPKLAKHFGVSVSAPKTPNMCHHHLPLVLKCWFWIFNPEIAGKKRKDSKQWRSESQMQHPLMLTSRPLASSSTPPEEQFEMKNPCWTNTMPTTSIWWTVSTTCCPRLVINPESRLRTWDCWLGWLNWHLFKLIRWLAIGGELRKIFSLLPVKLHEDWLNKWFAWDKNNMWRFTLEWKDGFIDSRWTANTEKWAARIQTSIVGRGSTKSHRQRDNYEDWYYEGVALCWSWIWQLQKIEKKNEDQPNPNALSFNSLKNYDCKTLTGINLDAFQDLAHQMRAALEPKSFGKQGRRPRHVAPREDY